MQASRAWWISVLLGAAVVVALFGTACGSTRQGPELLVTFPGPSGVTIEVVRASGGRPHRIAFLPHADGGVVSPDQSRVAVERGSLSIQPLGGTATTQVANNNGQAAWSPDGMQLAYVATVGRGSSITVYDTRTRKSRRLTNSTLDQNLPAWSPDGTRIAFMRYQPFPSAMQQNTGAVGVVSLRQRHVTRLSPYTYLGSQLAWTPVGRGIALTTLMGELLTFGVTRSKVPATLLHSGGVYAFAWSHDGATTAALTIKGRDFLPRLRRTLDRTHRRSRAERRHLGTGVVSRQPARRIRWLPSTAQRRILPRGQLRRLRRHSLVTDPTRRRTPARQHVQCRVS